MKTEQVEKILEELEMVLGCAVIECEEIDVTALVVYKIFIKPLILENELLKEKINSHVQREV